MGDATDFHRDDRPRTAQPPPRHIPGALVVHEMCADRLVTDHHLDDLAADLRERGRYGARKYGTPLQVDNGRNPLADAYEEVLDGVAYLEQHRQRFGPSAELLLAQAVVLAEAIRQELATAPLTARLPAQARPFTAGIAAPSVGGRR